MVEILKMYFQISSAHIDYNKNNSSVQYFNKIVIEKENKSSKHQFSWVYLNIYSPLSCIALTYSLLSYYLIPTFHKNNIKR